MADNKINMPGGMGGLVRYDSEYKSRFMLSPGQIVGFLIGIVVLILALKAFMPVPVTPAG